MNEELNDLESELRSYRPAPVSPGLRGRVASELERTGDIQPARRHRPQRWPRLAWLAAAAVVLAAAGLAWFHMFGGRNDQGPRPQAPPRIAVEDAPSEDSQIPPRPTRWAYQLAAADSPERLDELLDQHASLLLPPSPDLDLAGVLAP